MQKRLVSVAASAMVLGAMGVAPVAAHGGSQGGSHGESHSGSHGEHRAGGGQTVFSAGGGQRASFKVELSGANEVPVPGRPAVNDPDGKAVGLVEVKDDRITFALRWKGLTPSLGHIHQGAAGQNGALKAALFGSAMPDSVHSAAGRIAVTDAGLAQAIRTDPAGFYVNLHSAEFPGGAVRGQLKPLKGGFNPLEIVRGGALRAFSDGAQEVPKGDASKVGDPDGHAVTFLSPKSTDVGYSLTWLDIQSPSLGHIHRGELGKNGDVVFNFFNRPVPGGVFAVSGKLTGQNRAAVKRVRAYPEEYYSNIHTAEFPDGAVRGQLFD
ncbi:CHRD domain-containing protein [Streptomyces katsurahamanus]|uniref:CHRD domain-containing protein n=1 Tax=Streptomyces katsurahamanus TaxID=2577098 RepID=A0ABW9NYM2_9ACTN|nr:CHRD domain-containing protein [Streptomyces katsurahamanus]MQS37944.1 CHRD domain-containing protein [Streptomyces katsurahamanus]